MMDGGAAAPTRKAEETLVFHVSQQTQALARVLDGARSKVKGSIQEFVNSGISHLGQAIGIYCSLFTSLNVVSRPELESVFGNHYRYQTVQAAVAELEEVEAEWNGFLEDIHKQLTASDVDQTQLAIGSLGTCDIPLQDVRTGKLGSLASYLDGARGLVLILLRHFA